MSDDGKGFTQINSSLCGLQVLFPFLFLLFHSARDMIYIHIAIQPLVKHVHNEMLGKLVQWMVEKFLRAISALGIAATSCLYPGNSRLRTIINTQHQTQTIGTSS